MTIPKLLIKNKTVPAKKLLEMYAKANEGIPNIMIIPITRMGKNQTELALRWDNFLHWGHR
jgi:hypothetical protein